MINIRTIAVVGFLHVNNSESFLNENRSCREKFDSGLTRIIVTCLSILKTIANIVQLFLRITTRRYSMYISGRTQTNDCESVDRVEWLLRVVLDACPLFSLNSILLNITAI